MPLVPVLVNIESNGVLLDTEALKQSSQHFTVRLQEIEKEIYEMAGETFNISSAKQVGEVLFDKLKIVEKAKKTKTGQYVTSEEVLQSYRSKHDIIGKILEYRGLKKLLSTYIDRYRTPQLQQSQPAEHPHPRRRRKGNPQGVHPRHRLRVLLCRLLADRAAHHGTPQRR